MERTVTEKQYKRAMFCASSYNVNLDDQWLFIDIQKAYENGQTVQPYKLTRLQTVYDYLTEN